MSMETPYVVEFNVRFGDPECQITIPLIATDLGEVLHAASTDKLSNLDVDFHNKHAMTVVLAAENYPGPVEKEEKSEICQNPVLIHGLIMLVQ